MPARTWFSTTSKYAFGSMNHGHIDRGVAVIRHHHERLISRRLCTRSSKHHTPHCQKHSALTTQTDVSIIDQATREKVFSSAPVMPGSITAAGIARATGLATLMELDQAGFGAYCRNVRSHQATSVKSQRRPMRRSMHDTSSQAHSRRWWLVAWPPMTGTTLTRVSVSAPTP